jgi:hypothetical protein
VGAPTSRVFTRDHRCRVRAGRRWLVLFLGGDGPDTFEGEFAFADYKGNRQMLSTGNLAASDRVALFLMDYPRRERLKILGHARVEDARQHPELVPQVAEPEV